MAEFKYEVDENFDHLIEERGNQATFFRRVSWNEKNPKLEIRRWYVDGTTETAGKGVVFMTEEGPDELVNIMTKEGFGDTEEILSNISQREDFGISVKNVLGKSVEEVIEENESLETEEVYDPRALDLGIMEGDENEYQ